MTDFAARSFVIGDVHACLDELKRILAKIRYRPEIDKIVFVGDLVGRGPQPLETLEFIRSLGPNCVNVMGNHDLALILRAIDDQGLHSVIKQVAPDMLKCALTKQRWREALDWLSGSPFLYDDAINNAIITHAGIPPQLSLNTAIDLARDIERRMRRDGARSIATILAQTPCTSWVNARTEEERANFATIGFTKLKFCHQDGSIDLTQKGGIGSQPKHLHPWFNIRNPIYDSSNILVFGHWAALGHHRYHNTLCCDGGCVFGGVLIAVELTANFSSSCISSQFSDADPKTFSKRK